MAATTHMANTTGTRERTPQRIAASAVALGAAVAALANLALYGLARAADVDFTVRMSDTDSWSAVGAGQVGASSILAVLLGAGVAWLAARWWAGLVRWVRAAGIAVAVVSAGSPLALNAVDTTARPLLALMHLIAGAAFFYATHLR